MKLLSMTGLGVCTLCEIDFGCVVVAKKVAEWRVGCTRFSCGRKYSWWGCLAWRTCLCSPAESMNAPGKCVEETLTRASAWVELCATLPVAFSLGLAHAMEYATQGTAVVQVRGVRT